MQPIVEAEVSNRSFDLAATVRGITPGDIVANRRQREWQRQLPGCGDRLLRGHLVLG